MANAGEQPPNRPPRRPPRQPLQYAELPVCVVCRSGEERGPLIHPCACTGDIGLYHYDCVVSLMRHNRDYPCTICRTRFRDHRIQRYLYPTFPQYVGRHHWQNYEINPMNARQRYDNELVVTSTFSGILAVIFGTFLAYIAEGATDYAIAAMLFSMASIGGIGLLWVSYDRFRRIPPMPRHHTRMEQFPNSGRTAVEMDVTRTVRAVQKEQRLEQQRQARQAAQARERQRQRQLQLEQLRIAQQKMEAALAQQAPEHMPAIQPRRGSRASLNAAPAALGAPTYEQVFKGMAADQQQAGPSAQADPMQADQQFLQNLLRRRRQAISEKRQPLSAYRVGPIPPHRPSHPARSPQSQGVSRPGPGGLPAAMRHPSAQFTLQRRRHSFGGKGSGYQTLVRRRSM